MRVYCKSTQNPDPSGWWLLALYSIQQALQTPISPAAPTTSKGKCSCQLSRGLKRSLKEGGNCVALWAFWKRLQLEEWLLWAFGRMFSGPDWDGFFCGPSGQYFLCPHGVLYNMCLRVLFNKYLGKNDWESYDILHPAPITRCFKLSDNMLRECSVSNLNWVDAELNSATGFKLDTI